jgi:hypothetical protein
MPRDGTLLMAPIAAHRVAMGILASKAFESFAAAGSPAVILTSHR